MGEEIKEQPKQTTATEDMTEAGKHLIDAVWKSQEAQTKVVVAAGQTIADATVAAGQYAAEHPVETAVTLTSGLGGLGGYLLGKQIYNENEKEITAVANTVSDVGGKLAQEALDFSVNTGKNLTDGMRERPVTTVAGTILFPPLPLLVAAGNAVSERMKK